MQEEQSQRLQLLYEQYYDTIFRYCQVIVHYQSQYNPLIEDCVQDAFIKAIEPPEKFRASPNPAGWLAKAAGNKLRSNLAREERRTKILPFIKRELQESVDLFHTEYDLLLDKEIIQEKLLHIYDLLTEREKLVFHAVFLEGKSIKSSATSTGLSVNSVRAAVFRIRKRALSQNIFLILAFLRCYFYFSRTI